jgi:hypothetical protein
MSDAMSLLEGSDSDVNLSHIDELVMQLSKKHQEFENLELQAKLLKEEIDRIETVLLPEMMGNLKQIKTTYGATVSIKPILRANIKKEDRPQAFAWLDAHGHGGLIKTAIELAYGRGDLQVAKETVKKLEELGLKPVLSEDVHWQTLNAWAKEQSARGIEFPPVIGIYEGKKAEVKYGK